MRKFCLLLILSLTIPTLLTGCGQKKPGKLTFAVGGAGHEIDFIEKLTLEFTEDTGIEVEIIRQPADSDLRRQGLVIPLKARQSDPDLLLMDVAWITQFAASDWLEPLYPFSRGLSVDFAVFFGRILFEVDHWPDVKTGTLIGLPMNVDGGLLYYRKDLLKKYGYSEPPRRWNELIRIAAHIQKEERPANPNFYGYVWQGAQYEGLVCNFLEVAGSGKGGIFSKEGQLTLKSPENSAALRMMHDMIHKHKISPLNTYTEITEEESRQIFQAGNALFERNWPYAWALHQADDSPVKDKFGVMMLPRMAGGNSVSTLGGWHLGISKYSDAKWPAWKLLRFLLSRDVQKRMMLELGWNPARRDIYKDADVLEKMPHMVDFEYIFSEAIIRPTVPYYAQLSVILQKALNAALSGQITPDNSLAAAHKEIEIIRQRYHN